MIPEVTVADIASLGGEQVEVEGADAIAPVPSPDEDGRSVLPAPSSVREDQGSVGFVNMPPQDQGIQGNRSVHEPPPLPSSQPTTQPPTTLESSQ